MKKRGFREVRERIRKREKTQKILRQDFLSPGFCPKLEIVQFGLFPRKYFSFMKFNRAKTNFINI